MGDAHSAGVQVDFVDADAHQLGNPDAGEQKGLDEHDVLATSGGPDHVVVPADLSLGGHVGQPLWLPLDLDLQLGAQVPEQRLQVRIVGARPADAWRAVGLSAWAGSGPESRLRGRRRSRRPHQVEVEPPVHVEVEGEYSGVFVHPVRSFRTPQRASGGWRPCNGRRVSPIYLLVGRWWFLGRLERRGLPSR